MFGLFVGLTFASLLFVSSYTIITKVQYKKFDEKLSKKSNSNSIQSWTKCIIQKKKL